ncbi:hypothetical protein ILYODFUR_009659 [Ilyodon furcidens]|uniref:Uncharacterized protein n=1 Tax=Ilyodon furcidens TaxID=33524 RepID=A0ABV0VCL9_9TELE
MAPIANINLKRCWRTESTSMHKDNLGFFLSTVWVGGRRLFGGCNELGFQAKGEAEGLQHNYQRIRGWRCGTLLKTQHAQEQRHAHNACKDVPISRLSQLLDFLGQIKVK